MAKIIISSECRLSQKRRSSQLNRRMTNSLKVVYRYRVLPNNPDIAGVWVFSSGRNMHELSGNAFVAPIGKR
jgi:hypothetical protein